MNAGPMTVLLCSTLILLFPAAACAGGINLSWTDCGNAGTMNRTFACNTNTGNNVLVASFEPDASMNIEAVWAYVDIQSADPTTLNNWWQLHNPGSCRGTFVPNVNTTFGSSCVSWITSGGNGSMVSYTVTGNEASMVAVWGIADATPVNTGTEYYALNFLINNTRTVGIPSCAGCATPVCLVLTQFVLSDGGSPEVTQTIASALDRNFVTWQGATGACAVVPARNRTWGEIKSLYR